jgi:AcrR family transcriptional regulator
MIDPIRPPDTKPEMMHQPEPARARGRPKVVPDVDQKQAIAEAAWQLFIERGYVGTTMGEVAATARVSLRTVYRFFPGKPDLFAGVVDLHRRSMLALPGDYDHCSIEQALGDIFQVDIEPEADKARTALMRLLIVEGRQFPELGALVREHGGDRSTALLAEWLERQSRLGRADVADPQTAAKMLMDVVFGAISLKSGDGPEWPGSGDRAAYLRRCFAIIAEGVRPRTPAAPLASDPDSQSN